jgi:hypothetical protein
LSEEASEEKERLRLIVDKLSRAKLELLSILKTLLISEEELDEEARKAIEGARKELAKKDG